LDESLRPTLPWFRKVWSDHSLVQQLQLPKQRLGMWAKPFVATSSRIGKALDTLPVPKLPVSVVPPRSVRVKQARLGVRHSAGSILPERGAKWSYLPSGIQIPPLPPELMAAVEEEARAQARPVGELLADAVRRYLEDRSWHKIIVSARERSKSMDLTEVDVHRLIAESRSEQSR
jgi:hypothetical protein